MKCGNYLDFSKKKWQLASWLGRAEAQRGRKSFLTNSHRPNSQIRRTQKKTQTILWKFRWKALSQIKVPKTCKRAAGLFQETWNGSFLERDVHLIWNFNHVCAMSQSSQNIVALLLTRWCWLLKSAFLCFYNRSFLRIAWFGCFISRTFDCKILMVKVRCKWWWLGG